jgi:hypothetical protein
VIDGADKLRDGAKITIRPEADAVTPSPGPNLSGGKKRRSEGAPKQ